MKLFKYKYIILSLLMIIGCRENLYDSFPVISLTENENKQFTYTNRGTGFYMGNSHQQNSSMYDGWTVNGNHYLKDYRIFNQSNPVTRDSLVQFKYYPFSFIREYKLPIKETFTLLDSINAIVWEFESSTDLNSFTFEPLLPRKIFGKKLQLSSKMNRMLFSLTTSDSNEKTENRGWMGFTYIQEKSDRVVILAAMDESEEKLDRFLNHLTENYKDRIQHRITEMATFLKFNDTHTNIPELTDAISLAQLSLNALVTTSKDVGIHTGLPDFNHYQGRDTFTSLTGALLINGKYEQAKEILESFSRHQLQIEYDHWYGRIPNRITDKELDYNTSDVTWWFIRSAYEYFLFSGDTTFTRQIYPVIKRALTGAIRNRIDEKFYLLHEEAETWMDAAGTDGAWSPRGNRAVEIQALWYTALQIGSIFAGRFNDQTLKEYWLAISQTLKDNFIRDFWNDYKNRMYDHLNADGSADRKVRPNQILTVFIPHLPGIQPLIPENIRAFVTSNVLHQLTYHYGVASLSQEDKDFHPWYHPPGFYTPQEASHNGTVWNWLAGPQISSLLEFNQEGLAFNLYYNEVIQILYHDAIGNYSQLRDALPGNRNENFPVLGSVSQARSLAEFVRNFYQDFIGYQPDAPNNQVCFYPNFPKEVAFVSTIVPFTSGKIRVDYTANEKNNRFEFSMISGRFSINILLQFPGYDVIQFKLDDTNSTFNIEYDPSKRRSYHTYPEMNWYFAQPELTEGLRSLN
jgi:glycogen debranching enzyme